MGRWGRDLDGADVSSKPSSRLRLSIFEYAQAGDVIYTDVDRQGGGIVEFANKADQVPYSHAHLPSIKVE